MIIDLKYDDEDLIKKLESLFPNKFARYKIKEDFDKNVFSKYFIYMDKSNIIGFINYYDLYDRFEIVYIEVLKEHRNVHIGSKMMEHLINIGKQKNINNITLEVNVNNKEAIGLYNKYLFEVVAKRNGYYDGIDAYLMERKMM